MRFHIHGEAGIGKSRLVFELRNRAARFTHHIAQCLPEYKHNALFPILNLVRRKFSLEGQDPAVAVQIIRDELARLPQVEIEEALPDFVFLAGFAHAG